MTRRGVIACIAALAAAASIGALGYAVLWAFDFSELVRPLAPEPQHDATPQPNTLAPRRRPLVIVAPRVPGDDALAVVTPGAHAAPSADMVATAPVRQGDEPSSLIAVPPPPPPPTPGVDSPAISASARVSAASPAAERPVQGNTEAVSALVPQAEAAAPLPQPPLPVQAPASAQPDPEPTGTIRPPAFTFHRPQPIQRPRNDAMAPPPGVTIIRGVPPVPAASPGIVRPGPLIIQVPPGPRR
jgi:hypothetical protein